MPTSFKVNTLLSAVLAGTFYFFFMFAKHDPKLSAIVPFLDDPYDAIGSFAVISSIILVLIAFVRAVRSYPDQPTDEQKVFLIRTNTAIVLAVLITIVSDVVAMLRHTSSWVGTQYQGELIALLSAITIGAIAVGYLARHSIKGIHLPIRNRWKGAFAVSLIAIVILALYPENLIQNMHGHLFTIFVGMLLLFGPISALAMALIPFDTERTVTGQTHLRKVYAGIIVLLFALSVGLIVFLGEASEGDGRGAPLARVIVVFAVFVGMGALSIVIGYAFLRKPLGLLR